MAEYAYLQPIWNDADDTDVETLRAVVPDLWWHHAKRNGWTPTADPVVTMHTAATITTSDGTVLESWWVTMPDGTEIEDYRRVFRVVGPAEPPRE